MNCFYVLVFRWILADVGNFPFLVVAAYYILKLNFVGLPVDLTFTRDEEMGIGGVNTLSLLLNTNKNSY